MHWLMLSSFYATAPYCQVKGARRGKAEKMYELKEMSIRARKALRYVPRP